MIDCLVSKDEQTIRLRLADRLDRIPQKYAAEHVLLNDADDLLALEAGPWMIRWIGDLADLPEPHWFLYEAGSIRPGQYVAEEMLRRIGLANDLVPEDLPDGILCQVHSNGERLWLFGEGCAFDRSAKVPQLPVIMPSHRPFVLSCLLVAGGITKAAFRQWWDSRKDCASVRVRLVGLDCLSLDGEDLHERPQRDRIEALARFCEGNAGLSSAIFCERRNNQSDRVDERALSRLWVESDGRRIEQHDEFLRFAYWRRYDGIWDSETCNEALRRVMRGEEVQGVRGLSITLEKLRDRYRSAKWNEKTQVIERSTRSAKKCKDMEGLVRPVKVDGELRLEAPPDCEWLLGLSSQVVGDGLQVLLRPDEIEELGQDGFLNPIRGAERNVWAVSQLALEEASRFESATPAALEIADALGLMLMESGRAILGVQKHDFHELFLFFDSDPKRSGRYVWSLVERDGKQVWFGSRPQEQMPYLLQRQHDIEAAKAKADAGWIAWNPEGIRLLADTSTKELLPMNWEEHLETFELEPFVDFSDHNA